MRGDYFQFPTFPYKHIKRGSCPAKANFNLNFAFGGPAFADVALRCLLRCGFALVLQGLASVPFHNVCPVVACFSTSLGGVCGWGGGGRGGFRSSKCCCCFLQLFSCLAGCASCAPMGSETRTCTNELSIGRIAGGCSFQDLWVPLLLWLPISHPDSVGQFYGNQCFPCPRAVVRKFVLQLCDFI